MKNNYKFQVQVGRERPQFCTIKAFIEKKKKKNQRSRLQGTERGEGERERFSFTMHRRNINFYFVNPTFFSSNQESE